MITSSAPRIRKAIAENGNNLFRGIVVNKQYIDISPESQSESGYW
jgi:hypothetical protein